MTKKKDELKNVAASVRDRLKKIADKTGEDYNTLLVRYAIERLKAIVPIWKEENWSDGQVWVEGPRQPELAAEYGKTS